MRLDAAQPKRFGLRFVSAVVLCCLLGAAAFGDPLHKFHHQDGYWHHGSGWVFAIAIGAFKLTRGPYQIAGNDDVGAEYAMGSNGSRRSAIVDVYYPSSADVFARFDSAKAALQATANGNECIGSSSEEGTLAVRQSQIVGVTLTIVPRSAHDCSRASLYFFQTSDWVISVRTTATATDADAGKALDDFVRALPWETLGTDPFLHDSVP